MPVTVTSNFAVGQVKFTNATIMREVGLLVREKIRRRTAAGISANGQPFRPYSAAYAKQKAKHLGSGPVNLTASGGMLNNLQILECTDTRVTLGFV